MAFDTLTYARRLKEAGVPDRQAEAMADATREMVISNFATKEDLSREISALEQRLKAAIETLALRLMVRTGAMLAAGLALAVAAIGAMIKL